MKLFFVSVLFLVSTSFAGVEISEFMASNTTTLTTTNGLYEDWIEIHNGSGAAIDLAGWYLTDDPADLQRIFLDGGSRPGLFGGADE